MKSLAEQHPEIMKIFKDAGFHNLIKLCERIYKIGHLDKALGYNGAASRWFAKKNLPSALADLTAKTYLEKIDSSEPIQKQKESDNIVILMVSVPSEKLNKICKVLSMFDCEFVEI